MVFKKKISTFVLHLQHNTKALILLLVLLLNYILQGSSKFYDVIR